MKYFSVTSYGIYREFYIGQHVECTYYHEYLTQSKCYKRPLLQRIIDKPFKPVKFGRIVSSAGVHPFWLAQGKRYFLAEKHEPKTEEYLFVKIDEYIFHKAIPITCLEDINEVLHKYKISLLDALRLFGKSGCDYKLIENLRNKIFSIEKYLQTH